MKVIIYITKMIINKILIRKQVILSDIDHFFCFGWDKDGYLEPIIV